MKNTARSLRTKTEPKLFYKPWELRDFEKDQIDRQIEEADSCISKEVEDFEVRKAKARASATNEVELGNSAATISKPSTPNTNEFKGVDTTLQEIEQLETSSQAKPANSSKPGTEEAMVDAPADPAANDEMTASSTSETENSVSKAAEPKNADDDQSEELEAGQEDDVIY
jgi:hypothetical protein